MNATDQLETAARASAANITDPLSRAALAGRFRETVALCVGTHGGLHLSAADRGLHVDNGVEALLNLIADVAAELAGKLAAGDVFMTGSDYAALRQYKTDRDTDYTANPRYLVDQAQLNRMVDARLEREMTPA